MADPVNWSRRYPLSGSTPGGLIVQKDGIEIARRATLNFVKGVGLSLTVSDIIADGKINIRIDSEILNNLNSTRDPTINDDIYDGYKPGSVWVNISANRIFFCARNTIDAAVWLLLATSSGGVEITAHNELTGLDVGDDHPQYHNDARGDLRYLPINTKLDDLEVPDNNTDLNATVSRHGLLPRLSGNADDVLKGDGTWGVGGGSGGAVDLDDLIDVIITAPAQNEVLVFDGLVFRNAPPGTNFSFTITNFTSTQASNQLIGPSANQWVGVGGISFSAAYANGPATNAYVNIIAGQSSWSPALTLTGGGFTGPTVNVNNINYPTTGPASNITFRVTANKAAVVATRDLNIYFNNHYFWGYSLKANGFNQTDVKGLANTVLLTSSSPGRNRNINYAPGVSQYCVYAYPARLGTAIFTINGFPGGFGTRELINLTNANGYTEDYWVCVSDNPSLIPFTAEIT